MEKISILDFEKLYKELNSLKKGLRDLLNFKKESFFNNKIYELELAYKNPALTISFTPSEIIIILDKRIKEYEENYINILKELNKYVKIDFDKEIIIIKNDILRFSKMTCEELEKERKEEIRIMSLNLFGEVPLEDDVY